jgi:membrane fusion protein (multidrug efflux system)
MQKTALLVLAAVTLAACQKKEEAAPPGPPEVLVTPVVQQDVPIVREWLGTLIGSDNADIRARVQGYLMKQNYLDGAFVKKGDVLFEIDPRTFEAALAQAKAQLAQAEAVQGRSGAELQKQTELFQKKVTSQRDFDTATQNDLANKAGVEAAKAGVEEAQLALGFTKITAPVDGVVGIANVGIGDLVGPGSGDLASMSTVDPIKARFPISEQEYLGYAKQLTGLMDTPLADRKPRSELILADGSTFREKGTFYSLDRQVSVKTGTITVEVLFPNPGNVLRPGQYAKVRAVVGDQPGALLVPQRAVTEMQGSYSVAIVGADGKAEIVPVKVGERMGSMWVITQGLKAGLKVVVEGVQKVRTGAPVNAKPWTPPGTPAPAPKVAWVNVPGQLKVWDPAQSFDSKPEGK